jgi:hypothetical protein
MLSLGDLNVLDAVGDEREVTSSSLLGGSYKVWFHLIDEGVVQV